MFSGGCVRLRGRARRPRCETFRHSYAPNLAPAIRRAGSDFHTGHKRRRRRKLASEVVHRGWFRVPRGGDRSSPIGNSLLATMSAIVRRPFAERPHDRDTFPLPNAGGLRQMPQQGCPVADAAARIPFTRPSGGIGRRIGLKIRSPNRDVGVRVPSRSLLTPKPLVSRRIVPQFGVRARECEGVRAPLFAPLLKSGLR